MAARTGKPKPDRPATQRSRARWVAYALLVGISLMQPGVGSAGPPQDAARVACNAARTLAASEITKNTSIEDATATLASGACLRFITRYHPTGKTVVHAATVNVPSLLDVNGDNRPDLSAQIQVPAALDSVTMTVDRVATAVAPLDVRVEAVAPVPAMPGKEAAFGYDTAELHTVAPDRFGVTLRRTVEPSGDGARYILAVTAYKHSNPKAPLRLIGSSYKPDQANELTRIDPLKAKLTFEQFPGAPTTFEIMNDARLVKITSPGKTRADVAASIAKGTSVRRIWGHVDELPTSVTVLMDDLDDGRPRITYTASSPINEIEINTQGISMGALGAPNFKAVVRGLPSTVKATLPSGEKPFELASSGPITSIAVTANDATIGKYRHLYATVTGIPAAPTTPHRIYPPTEVKLFEVSMANGTALGSVDVELTEGARLEMPATVDGVYLRQELNPPKGRGEDAVHGRITSLRKLLVVYATIGEVRVADVIIDSTAGRLFEVRISRQTTSSQPKYLNAKLSSLRPNTRLSAGIGPITNTIKYSAGDSVRPRLDINTNMGDRESMHMNIPKMPKTMKACVSFDRFCMRDPDRRVNLRRDAHKKAFFSLDFEASHEMTVNVTDCIHEHDGSTNSCGHDSYGETIWGSMTLQNLALDAWGEWVEEDGSCAGLFEHDYCAVDNILGHVFIDTDDKPVSVDLRTDNTHGTDFKVKLNGLDAQNFDLWFDRNHYKMLNFDFPYRGRLDCGTSPELSVRPELPVTDQWFNVAGFLC